MINEKILQLRTHQAVIFERSQITYFTSEGALGKTKVNMKILPELQSVLIESANDRALVPFVNIAYMKLDSKIVQEKIAAKKKEDSKPKSSAKPQDIKKPR